MPHTYIAGIRAKIASQEFGMVNDEHKMSRQCVASIHFRFVLYTANMIQRLLENVFDQFKMFASQLSDSIETNPSNKHLLDQIK